jgi:GT2 family glycosyltransferase
VSAAPDISICIVSTDGRDDLLRCLGSVFEHPPAGDFEVLVIHNASSDGTAAAVRARYEDTVELI